MDNRDKGYYITFRLKPNDPEHIRVNNFLNSKDRESLGSKNKFIADALVYYLNHLEGKDERNNTSNKLQVTDNKENLSNLKNEILVEVQREVLSLIANMTINSVITANSNDEKVMNDEVSNALDLMLSAWEED